MSRSGEGQASMPADGAWRRSAVSAEATVSGESPVRQRARREARTWKSTHDSETFVPVCVSGSLTVMSSIAHRLRVLRLMEALHCLSSAKLSRLNFSAK
jgi:hypothetical protein